MDDTPSELDGPPSGPGPLPRRAGVLTLLFITVIAIGLVIGSRTPNPTPSNGVPVPGILDIGSPAPDFEVQLFDGSTFQLSEHLATDGRPVILNLWASWCGPCRAEMPDFELFSQAKPGILILGVAIEDREASAREFADELGITYPLGINETGSLGAKYPYLGLPATWVISSDGTIRREVIGQVTFEFLNEIATQEFGL